MTFNELLKRIEAKSEIYKALKAGVTAPARALSGELDPNSPEAVGEALNTAGLALGGGLPLAPKAAPGLVGTIHGPRSKLFSMADANRAIKLLREGATPAEVKKATGTEFTRNKQPVQEISDEDLALNLDPAVRNLQDVLGTKSPIFEAYPHLRKHGFRVEKLPEDVLGESAPTRIRVNANQSLPGQIAVTKHEIQHPIQRYEGWEPGGSPSAVSDMYHPYWAAFSKEMGNIPSEAVALYQKRHGGTPEQALTALLQAKGLRNQARKELTLDDIIAGKQWEKYRTDRNIPIFEHPDTAYNHLLGEAQANAVIARSNMSAEQLRQVPMEETFKAIGVNPEKVTAHRVGEYQWPISRLKELE